MRTKIFVSHSGEMGSRIAWHFKELLELLMPNQVNVVVAQRTMGAGLNWFEQIIGELQEAELCLCIVDRKFRESTWCSFEVGYYHALDYTSKEEERPKSLIFPMEMEKDHYTHLRKKEHPLAQLQTKIFSYESVKELITTIQPLLLPTIASQRLLAVLDQEGWPNFSRAVETTRQAYLGDGSSLSFDESVQIEQKERAEYLKDELLDMIKYKLSECLTEGFYYKEQGNPLSSVFISLPLRLLHHLGKTFKEAAGGSISITDQNFFETMWNHEIIKNVRKSIWTTNTRGSFARKLDPRYLDSQRRILEGGITITRVFIIGATETETELLDLAQVMVHQKELGIDVQCINERDFRNEYEDKLYATVGGIDFMVLDNAYVYLTNTDKQKNLVLTARLSNDNRVMPAINTSKSISDNRSTQRFADVAGIISFFKRNYPVLSEQLDELGNSPNN